jgi:hypothetical protein
MTPYDRLISCVRKLPSLQLGLKWFPSLEPHVSNNQDLPPFGFPPDAQEVSDCNQRVLINAIESLGSCCSAVMEIGVSRNGARSFTQVILDHMNQGCVYVGVDKEPRPHVHDPDRNVHMLQADSHDQSQVRSFLNSVGVQKLDLILIDGWHSVNTAVNDWEYVDLLRVGGLVVLHDTNTHPGPVVLYDAVDERQFEKHRYCTAENDMGISTFLRL